VRGGGGEKGKGGQMVKGWGVGLGSPNISLDIRYETCVENIICTAQPGLDKDMISTALT
jgi:hypothetical protein